MRNNSALLVTFVSSLTLTACQPMDESNGTVNRHTAQQPQTSNDITSTAPAPSTETVKPASSDKGITSPGTDDSDRETQTGKSDTADASNNVPNKSNAVYIGLTTRPVPVINIATPATLSVRDNCLVVTSKGAHYTALFNDHATLSGTTLRYEAGTLTLNKEMPVPGGIVMRDEFRLKAEPPEGCPATFFAVGG